MTGNIVSTTYGGADLILDPAKGVMTWDGNEITLMRVSLLTRIFGSIMKVPLFSTMLRRAGMAAGMEYALASLLGATPKPTSLAARVSIPNDLRAHGDEYLRALHQSDVNPQDRTLAAQLEQRRVAIRTELSAWLRTLPQDRLRELWQEMHDLDVYGGWGKAEITDLMQSQGTAHLRVTSSFVARIVPYWQQLAEETNGQLQLRVCSFFEGYFLGEARVVLGRDDLECSEVACLA